MIHQACKPSPPRPSSKDVGVGSGGSLHSSSTSPPPASRRSSIRGGPAPSTDVPLTSLESRRPLPSPTRFDHPWNLACYCAASIPIEMLLVPRRIPNDRWRIFGTMRRLDDRVIRCIFRSFISISSIKDD